MVRSRADRRRRTQGTPKPIERSLADGESAISHRLAPALHARNLSHCLFWKIRGWG